MGEYIRKFYVTDILDDYIDYCSEYGPDQCEQMLKEIAAKVEEIEVIHGVKVTLPPRNAEEMKAGDELWKTTENEYST